MKTYLACCLCFFLFACGKPTPRLDPLNSQQPILAFGDSLTFGFGANKTQSYPTRLSKLIDIPVINAGVNGELSAAGVTRLKRLLNTYNPQLLLLCHGGNDILQKGDLNKMADNLSAMITLAQNKGIQVILIAVPRVSLLLSAAQQYQQVADEKQVVIDNELLAELLKQPALRSDLVHLNASGYQQMAENIARLLRTHGAISG